MDVGIIVVWLSLAIYAVILIKAGILDKKERKWVYFFVLTAVVFSILVHFNISFNSAVTFFNQTFGNLSRMVVDI